MPRPAKVDFKLLEKIRLSLGTAAVLGLVQCKLDAVPTTAYTMTYTPHRCYANCAFCTQARSSRASANRLSRVIWPDFPLTKVLARLSKLEPPFPFQRLCIQTILYPTLSEDLFYLVAAFHKAAPHLPLSAALPPFNQSVLSRLKELGLERVAIALDAVTPELFQAIKGVGVRGPFRWEKHLSGLEDAVTVFGSTYTTTHFIIGLGETEEETATFLQEITDRGIAVGLFPFIPLSGTALAQCSRTPIESYRRIQLVHYLIKHHLIRSDQITFEPNTGHITSINLPKDRLSAIIGTGLPFQTAGCQGCNRPFFTEKPSGPLYNYPSPLTDKELKEIHQQLGGLS